MKSLIETTPASVDAGQMFGYDTGGQNFPGVLALTFRHKTSIGGFEITGQQSLFTLEFPFLESINGWHFVIGATFAHNWALLSVNAPLLKNVTGKISVAGNDALRTFSLPSLAVANGAGSSGVSISSNNVLESISLPSMTAALFTLTVASNPLLASLNLPALSSVASTLQITGNSALPSLVLPALVSVLNNFTANGNAALAVVSLPVFLPTNGKTINFSGCALTQASVDHILARCVDNGAFVSGTVNLSGGTNAVPGTQGQIDKAALIARGVTVTTN